MKKGERGFHDLDDRQLKELDEHFSKVSPLSESEQEAAQGKLRALASKFKLRARRPSAA